MFRILVAGLCLLVLSACNDPEVEWAGTDITGVMPDLEFQLTSETKEAVSATQWTGKPALLFFGYTQCPDVCPGTLQSLNQAIAQLPEAGRDDINVLFVSVDPARDTPEVLSAYTDFYGPQFVGLTGNETQLRDLAKRYRTTFGYDQPDDNGYYAVSHSSAIYGFDREGQARVLLRSNFPTDQLASDLETLLNL